MYKYYQMCKNYQMQFKSCFTLTNSNCVQQNIYPSLNECENNLLVSNFVIVQSDGQMHKWSKNKQNIFKCVIMIYCG